MENRKKVVLLVLMWCVIVFWQGTLSAEEAVIVRARIGIELRQGMQSRPAKARERVAVGDKFRLYAIPEPEPGYIYVVYADKESASLLNETGQIEIPKNMPLIAPSRDKLYEFDASSPLVFITIICSAKKLPELEPLLAQEEYPFSKWKDIEQMLIKRSEIDLSQIPLKPWPLTGTVRIHDVAFLKQLKISSGKSLVVKTYEFRIRR